MYRLFLALRYLRSRLVNLISVGGVMFGVAVLIVVTSVMDGFQVKVREVLRGNLSDVILIPTTETTVPFGDLERRLRAENRGVVTGVSPQVSALLSFPYMSLRKNDFRVGDRSVFPITVVGIDWEREREVSNIASYIIAGDKDRPFYNQIADEREGPTAIVSRTFAERFLGLGLHHPLPHDLIGKLMDIVVTVLASDDEVSGGSSQKFSVTANTYRVVISAVYDAEDTSMDLSRLFMDRETLRKMAGVPDEYQEVRVKIADPSRKDEVKRAFKGKYPGFDVETWEDQRRQFLKAVNSEKVLLVIVLSFIVLLGGFIILATLTLTVVEKTRDIGVLGALGANRRGILSLFLSNGFLIGVIGAVLGVLLGWLFIANVNHVKSWLDARGVHLFPPEIYLFREVPTVWSWTTILWIAGGSVFVAFLAGLIPAWRAARLDPVKALRYE